MLLYRNRRHVSSQSVVMIKKWGQFLKVALWGLSNASFPTLLSQAVHVREKFE